jgi:hypothetical protein
VAAMGARVRRVRGLSFTGSVYVTVGGRCGVCLEGSGGRGVSLGIQMTISLTRRVGAWAPEGRLGASRPTAGKVLNADGRPSVVLP